jgi:hypothetical protein
MIKGKQNTKTINDQKETEQKDYQWSKGNKTQRLSMIKRKQNTKTINDQKEIEHKDYQWSKGNRTQRLTMIKRKQTSCWTSHARCVTLVTNQEIIREWEWNCEYDKRKLWFRYSMKVNHSMVSIIKQWERWLHFFQICTGGWAASVLGHLRWQLLNCSFRPILNKLQY